MKNIKYPANSLAFNEILVEIFNLDLVPTEWLEEIIYKVRESESFNINFEASGIETVLFITNVGFCKWCSLFYLLYSLLCFICKKVNCCWERFGHKIFWNGLIRLYLSVY